MRRILITTGVAVATLLAPLALHTPLAQLATVAVASTPSARVVVKFRADSPLLRKQVQSVSARQTSQAQALGSRIGIDLVAGHAVSDRSHVVFARGISSQALAARIGAESDVEYAVVDERKHVVEVPNDPLYVTSPVGTTSGGPAVGQWYLKPPGPAGSGTVAGTALAAINAEQAWDITKGDPSIVVAVVDTGLRFDHPDLVGANVLPGYDMVGPDDSTGAGTDFSSANDGNGRDADASDPGDGITQADLSNPDFSGCTTGSSIWHGTRTLGMIGGATNNGVGMASIARNVRVMPVRALGKCGGFDSDITAAMLWAAGFNVPGVPDNTTPARVVNLSIGGSTTCSALYTDTVSRLTAAGVVVVAAAGNSGGNAVSSPANCAGAIGVGAIRHVGDKVGFSDLGPEVAISAPGGNCINTGAGQPCLYTIITMTNTGTIAPVAGAAGGSYNDAFNTSIGTSFSTPMVAGTVALMLSVQPALTPAQVKAKLQSSARPFPTTGGSAGIPQCVPSSSSAQDECYCTTSTCGAGMLDARAAVLAANSVLAAITLSTTTPTAGQTIALSSSSSLPTGVTIASYAWTILNAGSSGAAILGAANGATVAVAPTAAGTFTIQLTVTDSNGLVSVATLPVVVAAVVVVTPPTTPAPSSGGGGGGALGVGWLLLLLSAVLALAVTARREPARSTALSAPRQPSRKR